MSTEADIVERLLEKRGILDNRWPGPTDLEKEAAAEIVHLRLSHEHACQEIAVAIAERDAAARDMQERCATICDSWIGAHQHFQPKITLPQVWAIAGIEDIAEAIRALPTSVIATEGNGRD